jgi:hypothetical protein
VDRSSTDLPGAERCKSRFIAKPDRGTSLPLDTVLGNGWRTASDGDLLVPDDAAIADMVEDGEDSDPRLH